MIWTNAPLLEPVRASFKDDKSLVWTRVHDLPDFVYFSHEIHINKGVGCKSCHGPIDEMPLTYQNVSLQMEWCLSCHRDTKTRTAAARRSIQHDLQAAQPLEPSDIQWTAVL